MQWKLLKKEEILKTFPFNVEQLELFDERKQAPTSHPYYRLNCPDWVNVLPVTAHGQALLVKQSRAGTLGDTLEIPGGMIDPGEKDPTLAAARELEEETGFTSQKFLPLGRISPNPAIMSNNVYMFLALDVVPCAKRVHFPDENECIEVLPVDTKELDQLVRLGRINSALAALTIMLAAKYIRISEPSY